MADLNKIADLEKQLWQAADSLRANTCSTAQEYSCQILRLIFLRYAEHRFTQAKAKIEASDCSRRRSSDVKS